MYNKMTERIQGKLLTCVALGNLYLMKEDREISLCTPVQVAFYLECIVMWGNTENDFIILLLDDFILVWTIGCTFSHEP